MAGIYVSWVFHLGFILFGTLCVSWTWVIISFPILGKFSMIISSSIFFLFVFFFWDSYDSNVGVFNIVPEISEVVLISFNSFFFFPLFIYFYNSIFYLTNPIFCFRYSTICCLQSVFLFHLLHFSLYIDSFLFLLGPC